MRDTDRFDRLYSHHTFVSALARSLVRDPQVAEDIVQDTWLAALVRPPEDPGSHRSWLSSCVRNLVRMHLRRADRRTDLVEPAELSMPRSLEREHEWLRQTIVEAVVDLDEPYRTVIELRCYEGLSLRQIACELGVPVETARSRLKRARELLRRRLGPKLELRGAVVLPAAAPRLGRARWTVRGLLAGWLRRLAGSVAPLPVVVSVLAVGLFWFEASRPDLARSVAPGVRLEPGPASSAAAEVALFSRRAVGGPGPALAGGVPVTRPAGAYVLDGVLHGADGLPVRGALVVLGDPARERAFRSPLAFCQQISELTHRGRVERGEGWTSVSTDAHGRFRLELAVPAEGRMLGAWHPELGAVGSYSLVYLDDAQPTESRELELGEAMSLSGVVLGPHGPVAGAEVSVYAIEDGGGERRELLRRRVLSDDTGRFEPARLMVPGPIRLEVSAEGFARHRSEELACPPDGSILVHVDLEPCATRRGHLSGPGGFEANLARVLATWGGTERASPLSIVWSDSAISDGASTDGTLEPASCRRGHLDRLSGTYAFTDEGRARGVIALLAGENVLAEADVDPSRQALPELSLDARDLRLRAGGIRVRAVDRPTGKPATAFRLRLVRWRAPRMEVSDPRVVHAEHSDALEIGALAPGEYLVCADRPGRSGRVERVRVSPGETSDVRVWLEEVSRLFFRTGRAKNRARVFLTRPDGVPAVLNEPGSAGLCKANLRRGVYAIGRVPPGPYDLTLCAPLEEPDRWPSSCRRVVLAPGATRLGRIDGGARSEDLTVTLDRRDAKGTERATWLRIWNEAGVLLRDDSATGWRQLGARSLLRLTRGAYEVEASEPGVGRRRLSLEVPPPDGEPVTFSLAD
jgi:RNA polymerase sigma-70 factor (ECF subfamily)